MKKGLISSKLRKALLLTAVAVLVLGGLGFGAQALGVERLGWLRSLGMGGETEAAPTYQTTTVRKGDLAITVMGSGKVVAEKTADLAFSVAGKVAALNVQPGDMVAEGQTLAVLDGIKELEVNVQTAQLAVETDQKALDDLRANAALAVSQAEVNLADAQTAFAQAQAGLHQVGDSRCAPALSQEYYFKYLDASKVVGEWEGYLADGNTGYGKDFILTQLERLRKTRDQAAANLKYCQSYTDLEIQASQAAFDLAEARLNQAAAANEATRANGGIDPVELEIAQVNLENARQQLVKAQDELAGATLKAPIAGMVTAVNAEAGDEVGTKTLISIADMDTLQIQVTVDETDLQNFVVGSPARITFDSLSGQAFRGVVTQVNPTLVTVQSVSQVQGLVSLDQTQTAAGQPLPLQMTATVEVTYKEVKDALQVSTAALHDFDGETATVYVLDLLGIPEKRVVKLGMQATAFTEVLSGLNAGDRVITSPVAEQ